MPPMGRDIDDMNIFRGVLVLVIALVLPVAATASVGAMTHCERHVGVPDAPAPVSTASESMHHHGMRTGATVDHLHQQAAQHRTDAGCTCGCACAGSCHTACAGGLVMATFDEIGVDTGASGLVPAHTPSFIADAAAALPLRPPRFS